VSAAAVQRRGNLDAMLRSLAKEFRRFDFGTLRMRDGRSLIAVRRKPGEPGVYAVITDDEDEMRRALREDANFPPGSEAKPGGDQIEGPDG
jgi:hypothetical protein